MTAEYTLVICEEHAILRAGLRALIGEEHDMKVVGETGDARQALPLVAKAAPDLIIMDCMTQADNGLDVIAQLTVQHPDTRILVLTHQATAACIRDALRAGASGYVLKDAGNAELIAALRSVLDGRIYLSPTLSDELINVFLVGARAPAAQGDLDSLTNRERQVLKMVAEGRTSRYIAEQLDLSVKTVDKHRSNLMRKLDLHNVSALTTFAIGQGLVTTN